MFRCSLPFHVVWANSKLTGLIVILLVILLNLLSRFVLFSSSQHHCFGETLPKYNRENQLHFADPRLAPWPVLHKPQEGFCKNEDLHFLAAVFVPVGGYDRRRLWRETYGEMAVKNHFKILFIIGTGEEGTEQKNIQKEAEEFGDLLQMDFRDAYRNLTFKSTSLYRFYVENCDKDVVLMKIDEDMMWNVEKVVEVVKSYKVSMSNDIWCYTLPANAVARNPNSKWFVKFEEYPFNDFPDYCSGMAYLMHKGIVGKLIEKLRLSQFFWIDDVYATGLLRSCTDVNVKRIGRKVRINEEMIFMPTERSDSEEVFKKLNKI